MNDVKVGVGQSGVVHFGNTGRLASDVTPGEYRQIAELAERMAQEPSATNFRGFWDFVEGRLTGCAREWTTSVGNEAWWLESGVIRVYCGGCATSTAKKMTPAQVANLCGMTDIKCDVCGRKEAE